MYEYKESIYNRLNFRLQNYKIALKAKSQS